jgi:hypothetical protein
MDTTCRVVLKPAEMGAPCVLLLLFALLKRSYGLQSVAVEKFLNTSVAPPPWKLTGDAYIFSNEHTLLCGRYNITGGVLKLQALIPLAIAYYVSAMA